MIIKIPFKTPSVNHLYGFNGCRKFLTTEAKKLREEIEKIVRDTEHLEDREIFMSKPLKVTTYIYEDWYCKNGNVKRADVANREKFLIDSVFNALGIDDKFIFEHTLIKKQNTNHINAFVKFDDLSKEEAVISIEPL